MAWSETTDDYGRPQWQMIDPNNPWDYETGRPNYIVSSTPPDANGWVKNTVGDPNFGYKDEWISADGVRSPVAPSAAGANWWKDPANVVTPFDGQSYGTVRNPVTGQVEQLGAVYGSGGTQIGVMPHSEARSLLNDPSAAMEYNAAPNENFDFGGQVLLPALAALVTGGMGIPGASMAASLGGGTAGTIGAGALSSALSGGNPLVGAATSLASSGLGSLFGDTATTAATQLPGGQAGFDLLAGADVGLPAITAANAGSMTPSNFNEFAQMFGDVSNQAANTVASTTGSPITAQAPLTDVFAGVGDILSGAPIDDYGAPIGANNTSATYVPPDVSNPAMFTPVGADNTELQDMLYPGGEVSGGSAPVVTPPPAGGGVTPGQVAGAGAVAAGAAGLGGGSSDSAQFGIPVGGIDPNTGMPTTPFSGVSITGSGSGTGVTGKLTLKDLIENPTLENFTKLLTGEGGGYKLPLTELISGLMSYSAGGDKIGALTEAVNKATAASDPFSSQRPFYQGELKSMFTDPNYFANNPLLKGANANAVNDTSRALAARGYNMSGNEGMDIAQRLQNNNMQFGQNLMNQTGGFAGAGFGPGLAGQVSLSGNTAVANQGTQNTGQLGDLIGNLFSGANNRVKNPQTGTISSNDNLAKFLFG